MRRLRAIRTPHSGLSCAGGCGVASVDAAPADLGFLSGLVMADDFVLGPWVLS